MMKNYTKLTVGALCALFLSVSAYSADAVKASTNAVVVTEASAEKWTVSLGGAGQTVTTGDNATAFGAELSIGRTGHLILPLEVGVRQGVSYDGDNSTVFYTKLYSDWTVLSLAQNTLDFFGGANVGLTYGDVQAIWTAAPEVGLRWWLKKDVALVGRAEFPFRLNDEAKFTESVAYWVGFRVDF